MAHDPSLVGFADYFSAADAASVMEEGAPELFGLHADMELLGMPTTAAAHHHHSNKAGVLIDAAGGGGGGGDGATMRFLSDGGQQQPLSLSLCRPDGGVPQGMTLHQHLGGSSRHQQQAWTTMQDYSPHHQAVAGGGAAWHLRSSRFLVPAQQLLQEFCSIPVDLTTIKTKKKPSPQDQQEQEQDGGGDGSSAQIQAMEAVELQRLKDKLYIMLEEVDRRYRRYCEQMRSLAGGFEAVAGERAAAAYTALASRTISRHFRNLRDGIVAQLQAVRKALGEKDVAVPGMTRGETPRLRVLDQCIRQHKALNQAGIMETHPWRPQRGLPERAVTILRAWLFEHFLHPYPSDVDKHILARQTGLSRSQVSNWFINARVRLWKPMVEEISSQASAAETYNNNNGGRRHHHGVADHHQADNTNAVNGNNNGVDRKPTREQLLHDAGSLASIVNVGRMGGVVDQLDFDAYNNGHHQQAAVGFGGVSLTLGLQQHGDSQQDGGVNIAFGAPTSSSSSAGYLFAASSGHHHQQQTMQFGGAAMDGEAHGQQEHYRSQQLSAGFHLLRDLAG
ncbi:hypothetical protein PR202_gb18416 [Eleusine coracana subsp. coracana]|uniref:Homeobox domain-containing protein n=1 Tax=Eleusine coracana subsp. coracana TaxID=191504 RepID=A0AAV5F723_ELECO|nr:hypothetical protein PR202_gb18416 [Eleusine coracana subsp. coracana]